MNSGRKGMNIEGSGLNGCQKGKGKQAKRKISTLTFITRLANMLNTDRWTFS